MISTILSLLSAVITIYTLLCFIYILLSWFPGARYTAFGRFISSLCQPYMGFFSRWSWTRIGNIDFSPIISIGILSLASSILGGIQSTGRIYFGGILATIIYMLWNIISSLLGIFTLLIFVRWIILLIKRGQTPYDSPWNQVDRMLTNVSYKVTGTFIKRGFNYQTSLLVTWIAFVIILLAGTFFTNLLCNLCYNIPF